MDYMQAISRESDRFADVLREADPTAPVPTCPGWTAADLLWHLGEVHLFWAEVLRSGALEDDDIEAIEQAKPPRPTDQDGLLALFEDQTSNLLRELASRSDDTPAWFWLPTAKTVGSTRRMQAHEALMHRIDAELAAGAVPAPIDPELAADGIAHAFEVMWVWWSLMGLDLEPVGATVTITATDVDRSWVVQAGRWRGTSPDGKVFDEPGVVLVEGPASSDATVSGTAEAVDRWLWGRGPEPDFSGSTVELDALREAVGAGMN